MARERGTAIFAVNFEPGGQSPLDARLVVENFDELISAETYPENNIYDGMTVTVKQGESGKSELWTLVDMSKPTLKASWQRLDADAEAINTNITNTINSLNVTDTAEDGLFVDSVSQTNGKIKVSRKTISSDKVTATAIAGDTNKVAVSGTNVKAQIESLATTLKTVENNAAKYKVRKVEADLEANVKEAYEVVSYVGEETADTEYARVGDLIKVYKDGSLKGVELGTGTKAQTIIFTYDVEGTEKTIELDLKQAVFEADFGNGLEVNSSGQVSVKKDSTSDTYLSIGANGVKLSGIKSEFDKLEGDVTVEGSIAKSVKDAIETFETDVIGNVGETALAEGETVMSVITDNEEVTANAINALKVALGITGDELTYEPSTNELLSSAKSFKSADEFLAQAIVALRDSFEQITTIDCGEY